VFWQICNDAGLSTFSTESVIEGFKTFCAALAGALGVYAGTPTRDH
jgi:hypothetical protein